MIQKINSLIQTVYKAELLRKEAEYASLQAQTNPHFLYNTLDTICWQAKLAGNDAILILPILWPLSCVHLWETLILI